MVRGMRGVCVARTCRDGARRCVLKNFLASLGGACLSTVGDSQDSAEDAPLRLPLERAMVVLKDGGGTALMLHQA